MCDNNLLGRMLVEECGFEFAEGIGCGLGSSIEAGSRFASEEVVEEFRDDSGGCAGEEV